MARHTGVLHMELTQTRAAKLTALAMIIVVVTQIAYVTIKGDVITGPMIWTVEALSFLTIMTLALIPLARGSVAPLAWAALAGFGLFNVLQTGAGLAVFGPLQDAGEAAAPVFGAVLAGAFFFYFAGKVLVGVAAMALGTVLTKSGGAPAKAVGWLSLIAGLAALATNAAGLFKGMEIVQIAGAAGTAATLFAAIAILMLAGRSD